MRTALWVESTAVEAVLDLLPSLPFFLPVSEGNQRIQKNIYISGWKEFFASPQRSKSGHLRNLSSAYSKLNEDGEKAAGDGRESWGHDAVDLRLRHLTQVRLHEQGRVSLERNKTVADKCFHGTHVQIGCSVYDVMRIRKIVPQEGW